MVAESTTIPWDEEHNETAHAQRAMVMEWIDAGVWKEIIAKARQMTAGEWIAGGVSRKVLSGWGKDKEFTFYSADTQRAMVVKWIDAGSWKWIMD